MRAARLTIPRATIARLTLGAAIASLLGWRVAGVPGGLTAALVVALAPPTTRLVQRRRRERRYDDELLVLLRALARSLRSGATVRVALVEATVGARGPLAEDLGQLADDLDGGVVQALQRWADRRARPSVQLVAGGLALGYATGGITASVVDSLAESIRLRLHGRDETSALAAQATLSAVILAVAPLGFLIVGAAGGARSTHFLLEGGLGRACLAAGLALDGISLFWMLRTVRRVDR